MKQQPDKLVLSDYWLLITVIRRRIRPTSVSNKRETIGWRPSWITLTHSHTTSDYNGACWTGKVSDPCFLFLEEINELNCLKSSLGDRIVSSFMREIQFGNWIQLPISWNRRLSHEYSRFSRKTFMCIAVYLVVMLTISLIVVICPSFTIENENRRIESFPFFVHLLLQQ